VSVKEKVLGLIKSLPADADLRDIQEEIALLVAVGEADADVEAGRLVSHKEAEARLKAVLGE